MGDGRDVSPCGVDVIEEDKARLGCDTAPIEPHDGTPLSQKYELLSVAAEEDAGCEALEAVRQQVARHLRGGVRG